HIINNANTTPNCCFQNNQKQNTDPTTPQNQPQPEPAPAAPPAQSVPAPVPAVTSSFGFTILKPHIGFIAGLSTHILPNTASRNNWLFFSLLANIIMLFLGAYLRLRSGNSPGFI